MILMHAKKTKLFKEALAEMFRRVGLEYTEEYCKDNDWFIRQSWTEVEQNDFKQWLVKKIKRPLQLTQFGAEREAAMFLLNYGWTTNRSSDEQTAI